MLDTPFTDLLALVEQDGFRALVTAHSRGGQYNGPCPWCAGQDRFRVQPHHGPYGWYACNQCGRKGSAIDYLVEKRGLSKREALRAVGWQPKEGKEIRIAYTPASALDERPQWEEPAECWQDAARAFVVACSVVLWSDAGRGALDYLRGRGLTDSTIRYAMLGYHPCEEYGPAYQWGRSRPVKLWQGITIPWFAHGALWRVTVRDERVPAGPGRYKQLAGSSNGLYLADSLSLKRETVVVTEGEFDALSLAQECGKRVAVVATGTTQGGHTPRWLSLLERRPHVLIAFDGEEQGDAAASWWLERLSNAQRLRPLWKDANQMLQDGVNLSEWIEMVSVSPTPSLKVCAGGFSDLKSENPGGNPNQIDVGSHTPAGPLPAFKETYSEGEQSICLERESLKTRSATTYENHMSSTRSSPAREIASEIPTLWNPQPLDPPQPAPVSLAARDFPYTRELFYVRTRQGTVGYRTHNDRGYQRGVRDILDGQECHWSPSWLHPITWEEARFWWLAHTPEGVETKRGRTFFIL